ncbi:uncharacterized protein LOC142327325 [Lycorma delicatula]|uniref:uncharacterized protein LOC142327325 n=1 Tax=Lycorma delicatula TaxID=130591 RepID=UPI003F50DA63
MYSSKIFAVGCCVKTRQLQLLGSCNCSLLSTSAVALGRYKSKPATSRTRLVTNARNPGLEGRLNIIKQDTPDIESIPLHAEDFEELEGEFDNEKQIQEYIARKATKLSQKDELKITERKYFKPAVEPNMLTWSDKEQIRFLYNQSPDEWNIDRLAESFPATPEIIKKIIKSSWRPESSDRLRKHDENVIRNWNDFNEGNLSISCPLLKEHLKKFSGRSLPLTSGNAKLFDIELPKPQGSEYVSIIQSYKLNNLKDCKEANKEVGDGLGAVRSSFNNYIGSKQSSVPAVINTCTNDHSELDSMRSPPVNMNKGTNYTLDKLREKLKKDYSKTDPKFVNVADQQLLKGYQSSSLPAVSFQKPTVETMKVSDSTLGSSNDTSVEEIEKNTAPEPVGKNFKQGFGSNNSDLPDSNIPLRIHIPKSKFKFGYLYKVNDCFYSHDGFFLYRVPGMNSEST